MNGPVVRSANPAIREVTRELADARDAQILRAVAMVDAMPTRGAADEIVAPLRPRLARLRPPRPLRFARLLFLPLDPLIVPPPRWRPEGPSIPRSVIPVLARTVAAGLNDVVDALAGHTTHDLDMIDRMGRPVWDHASAFLRDARSPPEWEAETGLPSRFHTPLARRIAALLSRAETLRLWAAESDAGLPPPDRDALGAVIGACAAIDPTVQPSLIALLLARVPAAGPALAHLARATDAALRPATETAAALLLEQLESGADTAIGGTDLVGAGATARRMASLLSLLEDETAPPGVKDRVKQVRGQIARTCAAVFTERVASGLLAPLRDGPDADLDGLEAVARDLRTFETEARRLGGGVGYDARLNEATHSVREAMSRGDLGRTGGLRLTEILAGPEAALALFGLEA